MTTMVIGYDVGATFISGKTSGGVAGAEGSSIVADHWKTVE